MIINKLKQQSTRLTCCAFVFLAAMAASNSHAITIDLRTGGSAVVNSGSGFGNVKTFDESGVSAAVSAFAETGSEQPPGSGSFTFETAQLGQFSTGLGVCNRHEGTNCANPLHQVDNRGRDDLVAFVFGSQVDFESVTVDPFGVYDRDIAYWVGNAASLPNLTLETFQTLALLSGFSPATIQNASTSSAPFTHALSGTGNILLLSSHFLGNNDRFKIKNLTVSTVPLPGAVWLMISALAVVYGAQGNRNRVNN